MLPGRAQHTHGLITPSVSASGILAASALGGPLEHTLPECRVSSVDSQALLLLRTVTSQYGITERLSLAESGKYKQLSSKHFPLVNWVSVCNSHVPSSLRATARLMKAPHRP